MNVSEPGCTINRPCQARWSRNDREVAWKAVENQLETASFARSKAAGTVSRTTVRVADRSNALDRSIECRIEARYAYTGSGNGAFDSRDGNTGCTGVVGYLVFVATSNWPGWSAFAEISPPGLGEGARFARETCAPRTSTCVCPSFSHLFGAGFRLIFYSWNLFYHPGFTRRATVSCTRSSLRIKLLETNFSRWLR